MFGKRKQDEAKPIDHAPASTSVHAADHRIATYEVLGQTLVVTVVSEVLSGPDAGELICEIASRSAYSNQRNDKAPSMESGDSSKTMPRHFVLDLQNVEYMDSACLGSLVELLTSMQSRGGRIALVNAGRNVEYLFRLTQLDRMFPICRDVMMAIESVERGAPVPGSAGGHSKKRKKKRGWD